MKTTAKLCLFGILLCGLPTSASAFTMDFSSVSIGSTLPQTINVPGYGSVIFQSLTGAVVAAGHLTVQSFAPLNQNAIEFQDGESILMSFVGADPYNLQLQYAGVGSGESFALTYSQVYNAFVISFSGPAGETAGLQSIDFTLKGKRKPFELLQPIDTAGPAVPEPSSVLLGIASCAVCLVRRKRK